MTVVIPKHLIDHNVVIKKIIYQKFKCKYCYIYMFSPAINILLLFTNYLIQKDLFK